MTRTRDPLFSEHTRTSDQVLGPPHGMRRLEFYMIDRLDALAAIGLVAPNWREVPDNAIIVQVHP